jgi:hypothetical protein
MNQYHVKATFTAETAEFFLNIFSANSACSAVIVVARWHWISRQGP